MPTPPGRLKAALNRNLPSASLTKATAEGIYGFHSGSIKFDKENQQRGLSCADAGSKFKKAPTYTRTLLDSVKLAGKDEKLKLQEDTEKSIANIFANTKNADAKISEFSTAINDLNNKIKLNNANPKELKDQLHTLKGKLYKAMKEIHEDEIKTLKALFKTNDELKKQPDSTKDAIIDALKKSQQDQLKNFNKQVDAELRRMHTLTNQAEARILLCALMEKNGRNRDYSEQLFNAMVARNNRVAGGAQLLDDSLDSERFSEADFKELQTKGFTTKTGKTINISGEPGDKPGEIRITGLSIKSGLFGGKLTSIDFLEIALLAKSMGWDTIKINVYHSDPEIAKELAAEAYIDCIRGGFPVGMFEICLEEKGEWKKQEPAQLGVDPKSIESLLSSDTRLPDEDNPTAEYRSKVEEVKNSAPQSPAVTVAGQQPDPAATITGGPT